MNLITTGLKRYFAINCTIFFLLVSPVFASTAVTKDIKGQNVYITVAEKQDKPWWLDSAIQIITIATGFGIVIFQLGRQHKNTIAIEEKNAKNRLYLEIYQRIAKQANQAQEAEKLSIEGITLPNKIWDYVTRGRHNTLPERIEVINSKFNNYTTEITNLIILIE